MKTKIIICLSLLVLVTLYGRIETSSLSETALTINGQLNEILKNKTIVHLSDLHIGSIGKRENDLLEKINTIKPDIIFLTGDYVLWNGDYEPAIEFLSKLRAEVGIWAVMGDYDYSNSRKSCLFCHKAGSGEISRLNQVTFLKNSSELLEFDGRKIQISGIDATDSVHLKTIVSQTGDNIPEIVLSHNPLNYDLVDDSKDILILAGDTHGGQLPLPSWLWGAIGYEKNEKYNYGLYEDGQKKMFVTRGIGTSHLPIRLFCAPEIVVFRF